MKKDIEAIQSDMHDVKNSVRWLSELLDILEFDGRTLADILNEVKELKEKSESSASSGSGVTQIVVRPGKLRTASPKKIFGSTGGRKSSTRRTGGGIHRGSHSYRKR